MATEFFTFVAVKILKLAKRKKMNLKKISPLGIDVVNYMLNVEIISILNTPIYGLHTKIYTEMYFERCQQPSGEVAGFSS